MIKLSSRRVAVLALALCSTAVTALFVTAAPALAETCPNEEFRTGLSAALPDCRAYELVTPPFKEGTTADYYTVGWWFNGTTADGSHVVVESLGNYGDAQQNYASSTYLLARTESGWNETNMDLPASRFVNEIKEGYPVPEPVPVAPGAYGPEDEGALYAARENTSSTKRLWLREADGALREVGPFEPPPHTGGGLAAASSDLSHVLISSTAPWPGDEAYAAAGGELYEYIDQSGPPVPVGFEPDGAPCAAGLDGMSKDGSTVVFTCGGQIFARIDNGEAGARTVAISEPSAADCSACDTSAGVRAAASVIRVSTDGSKVFFTTTQPLLGADTSENIYEYDFDAPQASAGDPDGRVVEVSSGDWGPAGARIGEIFGVAEDGSHVYFTSSSVLGGAVNDLGQAPVEGGRNFYVFERDAEFPAGRLSFIATSPRTEVPYENEYEVTANGQFLVFTSKADLTPGDTSTAAQVFEYDAETGKLVRCSIGQNGFNDNGNTDAFNAELPQSGGLTVSENGEYVAFQSTDGLTPGALNGLSTVNTETERTIYLHNVYEYHDGSVYLISDGQDTSTVEEGSSVRLEAMSPSGRDIFFTTADQLVPQDLDTEVDLYDARIDGGFPAPASLLPTCQGDACQGPLTGAPVLLSPGSEFQAGGNPPLVETSSAPKPKPKAKAKGCKKGQMKRRGRCVKSPKAKKVKARKAGTDRRAGS
jgi:hypothetical protein